MRNLAAIRTGIRNQLGLVVDLQVYDYETLHPQLPAAVVRYPQTIDLRAVYGDTHWNYLLDVLVIVAMNDDVSADNQLEALLAEDGTVHDSVIVALRADQTLGGVCDSAEPITIGPFGAVLDDTGMSATVTLEVST